jgi:hypothetical protein
LRLIRDHTIAGIIAECVLDAPPLTRSRAARRAETVRTRATDDGRSKRDVGRRTTMKGFT